MRMMNRNKGDSIRLHVIILMMSRAREIAASCLDQPDSDKQDGCGLTRVRCVFMRKNLISLNPYQPSNV